MTTETINAIKELMSRATLKGSEVQVYNACVKALDLELKKIEIENSGAGNKEG